MCAVVVYWSPLMILNPATRVSNPEWGLIYYEASITAQGLPNPSSFRGSTLGTRAAEYKGCNWACKLIDGCSLALCSATVSVVSAGICNCNCNCIYLYSKGHRPNIHVTNMFQFK